MNRQMALMILVIFLCGCAVNVSAQNLSSSTKGRQTIPVLFIENKGQISDMENKAVPFVLFKIQTPGLDMYITEKGLTYVFVSIDKKLINSGQPTNRNTIQELSWELISLELKGARICRENIFLSGESDFSGNYFYAHCPKGIASVKNYERIVVKNIYPGIDWTLYGSSEKGFKYDFVINPGANHRQIILKYSTANPVFLNESTGSLHLKTKYGLLEEFAPYCYQNSNRVASSFSDPIVRAVGNGIYENEVQFNLSEYNPKAKLIIDPLLEWGTYYGGNSYDIPYSTETDLTGNSYITGYTNSTNFPVLNPSNGFNYYKGTKSVDVDIFILKFNSNNALVWSTYFGGNSYDAAQFVKYDGASNIFITGSTYSTDLPQQNLVGAYNQVGIAGSSDAFVLKFDILNCQLLWATYYGGSGDEWGASVATDLTGNIFITGHTTSANFPLQPNGLAYYQSTITVNGSNFDAFIIKFNNLNTLVWSTFYGGGNFDTGNSVVADPVGNIYLTGQTNSSDFPLLALAGAYNQTTWGGSNDSYVLKFTNSGILIWATYFGGAGTEYGATAIADAAGNVFLNGRVSGSSTGFPTMNPMGGSYFQGSLGSPTDYFIVKFNSLGVLLWSTFFGGSSDEESSNSFDNCSIDLCGNIYLAFTTKSSDMPLIPGCAEFHDGIYGGGNSWGDCFLIKFSNTGTLLWDTYLGGGSDENNISLANDINGALFLTLRTFSNGGVPLLNKTSAYNDNTFNGVSDLFITKFSPPNTYSQSQVNSGCSGCSGSATVSLNCSNARFNYMWSNGDQTLNSLNSTNTVTGLCIGTYTVTVTSNCSQTLTATYTINGSGSGSAFTIGTTVLNVNCNGGSDGSILANISGGTSNYTYSWSNGMSTITNTPNNAIQNLVADNYTLTITDSQGCTGVTIASVLSPPPLAGQYNKGTANCSGCGCKEWIMVNSTGGTAPYSYSWPDGYANRYKNQLCPGAYSINIKDKNGCSVNVNLTAP